MTPISNVITIYESGAGKYLQLLFLTDSLTDIFVCVFFCSDAGHYHKDAGKSGSSDQEYRLVESMRLYARAIYVTSQYRYEGVDSLQLNKHTTACAQLIVEDIILDDEKRPRAWGCESNAIAFCTWLAAFVDSLLYWEEQSSHSRFVEILAPSHKFFVGKMLQYIPQTIRQQAMGIVLGLSKSQDKVDKDVTVACTPESLLYFDDPRSQRMTKGLLSKEIEKPKIAIREIELAMVTEEEDGGRRSKRRCRR